MRHFIYQDEKSHKFWAVEQQGNELHVSWGKVGTNGQNQVKSLALLQIVGGDKLIIPFC
ncbi:WGR domain-containing protein [Escherichia coli]|nr:WGR domain-containing protein [Escherichia coli]MDK9633020.1 WGR domain-containing protein [Escherichia coli]